MSFIGFAEDFENLGNKEMEMFDGREKQQATPPK